MDKARHLERAVDHRHAVLAGHAEGGEDRVGRDVLHQTRGLGGVLHGRAGSPLTSGAQQVQQPNGAPQPVGEHAGSTQRQVGGQAMADELLHHVLAQRQQVGGSTKAAGCGAP